MLDAPLAPYRVLDLTDESGFLCGKILADLGADVILIEPPEGSTGRRVPPLRDGESLYFRALNLNKRGITLDLETATGQEQFATLVAGADFLVESFPNARLAALGFPLERLSALNPRLVTISISPFGRQGPYASFRGADLVIAALSGHLHLTGDADRPPVRLGPPYQSHFLAGAEAAAAALVAHHQRQHTGKGVAVDVPALLASVWSPVATLLATAVDGSPPRRSGTVRRRGGAEMPLLFACADGQVVIDFISAEAGLRSNEALARWMAAEGHPLPEAITHDWGAWLASLGAATPEVQAQLEALFATLARFLRRHGRQELFERAVTEGILLAPVNMLADIVPMPHLSARAFFWEDKRPAKAASRYTGAFAHFSRTPLRFRRPAPALGEHNSEVRGEATQSLESAKAKGDASSALRASLVETPRNNAAVALAPAASATANFEIFAGLKVVDFTWMIAGPVISQYLSTYGATVVHVECRRRPDPMRSMVGPFAGGRPGFDRAAKFVQVNTGKLGLALDLGVPAGLDLARRLVSWADVVVECFTPGTMERWGLDYPSLAASRPDLVYLSSSLLGRGGLYAGYGGFGDMGAALSGFHAATGWPDRGPNAPYSAYTDAVLPPFAAAALLAALDDRRRTGRGQHIELSHLETGLHFLGAAVLEHSLTGQDLARRGNRGRATAPHSVYPVAGEDAWIAIVCRDDADWEALCSVLGAPALAGRPEFAGCAGRLAAGNTLDQRIAGLTVGWEGGALMTALQERGVAAGLVQDARALLADPQLAALGYLQELDHPEIGRLRYEGPRFLLNGAIARLRRGPLLGEHTRHVLYDLLGLDTATIDHAAACGAIEG